MTIKKRLIVGLFANGFGQVVTILIQLTSVPLFIYFWGVEKYGEWLILSAIPAYLAMSDFGFASVAANDMTMNVAKGERHHAIRTFHSTLVVILLAALVSGLVAAGAIVLHITYGLLPVKHIIAGEVAAVITVLWLQVIVAQIGGQIGAAYRCDGNFAIGTLYGNLVRLLEFLATAAALLAGGGFVFIVLSMLAVRTIGTYAMFIDMRHRSPWLSMGLSQSSWVEIRRLMRPALAFMAFPLGNAISLQGFTLVIGSLLGGSAVALFSIHRTLTRLPLQMMTMINATVWPELSIAFGVGTIEQARKLHRLSVAASFWCVLVALTCLFFIGGPLINFWTSGKVPYQQDLLIMLGLVVLANSLWFTSSVVAASCNRHENIALIYLLGSLGALCGSILFGSYYSLQGIVISLFFIDALMIYFVMPQSLSLTNDNLFKFAYAITKFPEAIFWSIKLKIRAFIQEK